MQDTSRQIRLWHKKMFWLMWGTYASFYLLRVNISVAVPEIMEEFDFSRVQMGMVLSSQFFLYAMGQFINGQLGDRLNARRTIAAGLALSALINIMFGLTASVLTLMVVLWGINGYFQSMGWGPTVKAMSNWFPAGRRSVVSGRLGTCYIFGGAFSWFVAGSIIAVLGWRYTFWLPSVLCALVAFNWYYRARSAPEEIGLPCVEDQEKGIFFCEERSEDRHIGFGRTLSITLLNPYVWVAAFALFGINTVRYGFMDWAPTYIFEHEGATASAAAFKAVTYPAAGILGALFAGWLSGRYFQNRKATVALVMLLLLMVFCYIFPRVYESSRALGIVVLMLIGFFTFGPHVLVITALPADLGTRKAASSVTGFIDAIGYMGAALTGVLTGYLADRINWDAAFYFWIAGAMLAAAMMLAMRRFERTAGQAG